VSGTVREFIPDSWRTPMTNAGPADNQPIQSQLGPSDRFWRNRLFAWMRHRLTWMRRSSPLLTRAHAAAIRLTGGRIRARSSSAEGFRSSS
jgi:hypothetical protein